MTQENTNLLVELRLCCHDRIGSFELRSNTEPERFGGRKRKCIMSPEVRLPRIRNPVRVGSDLREPRTGEQRLRQEDNQHRDSIFFQRIELATRKEPKNRGN